MLIGLARLCHEQARWDEALSFWEHALSMAECLGIGTGWNAGLVLLHEIGNISESHSMLHEARKNMNWESRVFWIAEFNSKWHDAIVEQMAEVCKGDCGNGSSPVYPDPSR